MKIAYLIFGAFIFLIVALFVLNQYFILTRAHSSFENYYAFRGCSTLVKKTETYGICKTSGGDTIKIVKYQGKWYLDGDLPWGCFGNICLGW